MRTIRSSLAGAARPPGPIASQSRSTLATASVAEHLRQRYLYDGSIETLARRVARTVAGPEASYAPLSADMYAARFEELIATRQFLPAGNTLLAGARPLRPNCAVLGNVTDATVDSIEARSERLWSHGIGIGYDLTGCTDPAGVLRRLSRANDAIELGHRPKRGNMAVVRADHPQVLSFVGVKNEAPQTLYNFNISVAATDRAMRRANEALHDTWLDQVAYAAWRTGDPGFAFVDTANQSVQPLVRERLGAYETCVPCGEQFMHTDEVCNLGAVNLRVAAQTDGVFDETRLRRVVRDAVRFMDNVVDLYEFPDQAMADLARAVRRVGLGVTGFADFLADQGADYAGPDALAWAGLLAHILQTEAHATSRALGRQRGGFRVPGVNTPFPRRNITLTCIAPTGGITLLTDNRGFAIDPVADEMLSVPPRHRLKMQARFQRHVDNAISSTIALPHSATAEDVWNVFVTAHRFGLKGVTVFREGCRNEIDGGASTPRCPTCD